MYCGRRPIGRAFARTRQVRVGDVEVRRIEEIMLLEPSNIFAQWRKEMAREHAWLTPNYYDAQADAFVTSIHSWLLKMPGRTVLIDTASGNGKERPASPRFAHLDTPYLQRLAAAGTHWALYALLLAQPIIGWIATSAYPAPIPVFGLFELPPLSSANRALSDRLFALHAGCGIAIAGIVALHVGAACHHHFVRKDRVLLRMLTG